MRFGFFSNESIHLLNIISYNKTGIYSKIKSVYLKKEVINLNYSYIILKNEKFITI